MIKVSGDIKVLILNLPNPPFRKINREYAGGFGTAHENIFARACARPYLNLFLPYSTSIVEEVNYDYKVLDSQVLSLSPIQVLSEVKRIDPNVILSMISLPSIYADLKLLTQIKEELPNTLTIAMGTVCKVMPSEVLNTSKVDLIIRDKFPYVSSLADLMTNLHRLSEKTFWKQLSEVSYLKDSNVINTRFKSKGKEFNDYIPKYDSLPLHKYDRFLDLEGKRRLYMPILRSTGCVYNCFYCPYLIGFGRKLIYKHIDALVDEIEYLSTFGIDSFLFRDQSFTYNKKQSEKFCNEIIRRNLDISWFCEARVDEISRDLLHLLKKSGCERINYGVETGDPNIIKTAKPGINLEKIRKTFIITKKIGIWAHAQMIIGLPGETRETLTRTSRFIQDLDPDGITFNFATPYPGTQLFRMAKKNNWITTYDWRKYSSFDVVMRTNDLNPKMLYDAKRKMNMAFLKHKISRMILHPFNVSSIRLLMKYYAGGLLKERLILRAKS